MPKVERKYLVSFVNTGTFATPIWKLLGIGTPDNSLAFNVDKESITDVTGLTSTDIKKIEISQAFDPVPVQDDDDFQEEILKNMLTNNVSELANKDVLVVIGWNPSMAAPFDAYRYTESTISAQSLGGDAYVSLPFTVDYGGEVMEGTVDGIRDVTFTPTVS
ncbi:MAG: hypothetical protein LBL34_04805 [Clostridiales bacterium]|jgi:hypothetical protein|nr:hypothetical protein [Clostridiales bacterium]